MTALLCGGAWNGSYSTPRMAFPAANPSETGCVPCADSSFIGENTA
jgi:hypothetical protein